MQEQDSTKLKLCIFDLDGVITDTALSHFNSWKKTAQNYNLELPDEAFHKLKGISRKDSLIYIKKLDLNNEINNVDEQFLMNYKNELFLKEVEALGSKDVLPGILNLLIQLRENSIKVALASASLNAPKILAALNLSKYFDYIANPAELKKGKPDPEIFVNCLKHFNINSDNSIGFEDAPAGIEAINEARIFSVGIGDKKTLREANFIYQSTKELNLPGILKVSNKAV